MSGSVLRRHTRCYCNNRQAQAVPSETFRFAPSRRFAPPIHMAMGGHGSWRAQPPGFTVVFLMCHIGSKIALPRTFPSSSHTSGKHHPAPQPSPGPIPEFLMCHIRSKITLPHTFTSSCVTSGNHQTACHRQVALSLAVPNSPSIF